MIAITDATADGRWDFAVHPLPGWEWMHPGRIHSGGANALFCDGHVQWYPQEDLVIYGYGAGYTPQPGNSRTKASMWNNTNQPTYRTQ